MITRFILLYIIHTTPEQNVITSKFHINIAILCGVASRLNIKAHPVSPLRLNKEQLPKKEARSKYKIYNDEE